MWSSQKLIKKGFAVVYYPFAQTLINLDWPKNIILFLPFIFELNTPSQNTRIYFTLCKPLVGPNMTYLGNTNTTKKYAWCIYLLLYWFFKDA